ncbi:hypothetical protein EBZ80_24630 [bacterium]|nr:hypothetical protein [bacterium]
MVEVTQIRVERSECVRDRAQHFNVDRLAVVHQRRFAFAVPRVQSRDDVFPGGFVPGTEASGRRRVHVTGVEVFRSTDALFRFGEHFLGLEAGIKEQVERDLFAGHFNKALLEGRSHFFSPFGWEGL